MAREGTGELALIQTQGEAPLRVRFEATLRLEGEPSRGGRFGGTILDDGDMGDLVRYFLPLVIAVIGAVMAYWGWVLLLDGLDIRMAGAPIPQSLPYLPLSIGGLLMVVFALNRLVRTLAESPAKGNN